MTGWYEYLVIESIYVYNKIVDRLVEKTIHTGMKNGSVYVGAVGIVTRLQTAQISAYNHLKGCEAWENL